MADNINIPNDLTKVVNIKVEDNSTVLRKFLIDLTNRVNAQEKRISDLEKASAP